MKISENLLRSELGQILKSSIIVHNVAIHMNCKMISSFSLYFINKIISHAIISMTMVDIIQLKKNMETNIISPDREYSIFSDQTGFLNEIYRRRFQNKAEPIYPQAITIVLIHHTVIANQLQLGFTCTDDTFHRVIYAKNECQNSCRKVTIRLIG